MRNRTWSWTVAGAAVALVVVGSWLPLFLGRVSPIWDAFDFYGPYLMLVGDFARNGQFLLWNPFINGGSPDYVEPQTGAFSPLVILIGGITGGSRHGFELYWLLIWLMGPLGVLVLGRHLGTPPWGGLIAALGIAFSGFYTGNAEHTSMIAVLSFLPWILWRMDVALASGRARPAIEAGGLWGLSALAGYPGLVLLNACFVGLWSLARAPLRRVIPAHALMLIVGLAVLLPTYAGFFVEAPGYSRRAGALPRRDAVESNALHPRALATAIRPELALRDVYEYTDISMRSIYAGALVPILAVLGLVRRREGVRWWLLLLALLFLAAAMGRALPLRGWLYDWFPPTRYFRHSALFRCYYIVALTMLSFYGARDLSEIVRKGARRARTLAAVVPIVLVLVAVADAISTSWLMRPVMYGEHADTWRGLSAVHSGEVEMTARGLFRVPENGGNLTFTSKTPAMRGYGPLAGPLFQRYADDAVLLASATGPQRLWFSASAVGTDRSEECFDAFRARAAALGAPPLVVHSLQTMNQSYEPRPGADAAVPCATPLDAVPAAQRLDASAVTVTSYTPTALRMRVDVPGAGWLLVTESWSHGWHVAVNGAAAPIRGGNFIFRAVQVQPGINVLDFTFSAYGFPWLVILSWGTLGAIAVWSAVAFGRTRREPSQ